MCYNSRDNNKKGEKMKKILMLLALCACGEKPDAVTYRCENPDGGPETVVKARFFDGGVDVDINGVEKAKLLQVESASGALYYANGIELWTKGDEASLSSFGAGVDCSKE
jgi:membrane-bound inhibitor of C-type lysozyme